MDILIIKPKWVQKIFRKEDGWKQWEIRGSNTKKRGWIEIAESGTGLVTGRVYLSDSIPLTKELWDMNTDMHQVGISYEELIKRYKTPHAWVFTKREAYEEKRPYIHPKGAVIWVKA